VAPDGLVTGQIVIDAASLDTWNNQRDKHLRSADFFNSDENSEVVLAVIKAAATPDGRFAMVGTLQAAGLEEPVCFTADLVEAGNDAVTLRAELTIDRSRYGMTLKPDEDDRHAGDRLGNRKFIRDAGGVASSRSGCRPGRLAIGSVSASIRRTMRHAARGDNRSEGCTSGRAP
jgi:hypothetical protein